ncbi:MAG: MotA/TolQ/ExbB proton channel family protein [Bacteroidia bacterium]|nr:MotA/TolQ/ExbB proton channel family protein [Bacteroidia bacterium]
MKESTRLKLRSAAVLIVFPISVLIAYIIYAFVLGDPSNFVDGNNANEPLQNNYLGVIYKGGPLVVLLIAFQVILLTFIIERSITIFKANGKANNNLFVKRIKTLIQGSRIDEAIKVCDDQKGSSANVLKNGLQMLNSLSNKENKEESIAMVQKEIDDTTYLEIPHLNKNMNIISTLASISTLAGLLGTVTGMIKAFSALARVGSPDAVGLAAGISQALVTTALGISTALVAIVFYNIFTGRIDNIIDSIEQGSMSIMDHIKRK